MSRKAPHSARNYPHSHTGDILNYPLINAVESEAKPGAILTAKLAQKLNNEVGKNLHDSTALTDLFNKRNNAWFSVVNVLPGVQRNAVSDALQVAIKLYITVGDVRGADMGKLPEKYAENSRQISFLILAFSIGVH